MSQSQENIRRDGKTDDRKSRQILYYRTLPAKSRGLTTSLQQLTGKNTPNIVLKLTYFLKISPLMKILQF